MPGTRAGTAIAAPGIGGAVTRGAVAGPMMIEQADPMAPAFAGAALGASAFTIFGGLALIGAILGAKIPLVSAVKEHNLTLWALMGIGFGISLLFFIIGFITGKR